jgi:hypothetical protein
VLVLHPCGGGSGGGGGGGGGGGEGGGGGGGGGGCGGGDAASALSEEDRRRLDSIRSARKESFALAAQLKGHRGRVYGLAVGAGGDIVCTGDEEGVVYVWSGCDHSLKLTLRGHRGVINAIAGGRTHHSQS